MKYVKLGHTDLEVSEVGFGVLTMGSTQLALSIEEGSELIRYALSKGFNFLDTAQYYDTYKYIYPAIKDGTYNPVICSKSLEESYEGMEDAIKEALAALDREYIDIFLMHEVREDPDFEERAGAWQCLIDYKAKGIVKAIGVSTHHVDVTFKCADIPELDVVFPLINYASLGIRKGNGFGTCEEMEKAIRKCADNGKGIFTMKTFGGGNLTKTYQKALDYGRSVYGANSLMVGFGRKSEVDQMIDYLEGRMEPGYQPDVSKKRIRIDQGDCEGCGACKNRCPNHAIYWNENGLADVNHDICLTCGYCAPVCPVRAIIMF